MRTIVDERYLIEREQFCLRATCGYCQHFDHHQSSCSLGFPVDEHLDAKHAGATVKDAVRYCKYFEIEHQPLLCGDVDTAAEPKAEPESGAPKLVNANDLRPEGYTGSCLRPMGLCDLGACDGCMYNPELPQFKNKE